jgi:predicted transcriptional regulator
MLIHSAIKKAKAQEAEKVAISLKVSADLKEKLQKIADKNKVSLNGLCSSILESALNGELDEQGTMKLVEELNLAQKTLQEAQNWLNNGEKQIEANDGSIIDFELQEKIALAKISAIMAELKRRGVQ